MKSPTLQAHNMVITSVITVRKPQDEYETWLRFLGDLWVGDFCTDPTENGAVYMSRIRRWASE